MGEEVGKLDDLTPENSKTIWEKHEWNFVHEFLDDIPELEKGYEYCFWFELIRGKCTKDSLEFPMFMMAVTLPKLGTYANDVTFGCSVQSSTDDKNHFILLRRK